MKESSQIRNAGEGIRATRKLPIVTLTVLAVTGFFTALGLLYPGLLTLLQRQPQALARHEWWRLLTPLLIHSDGWRQICFNFPAILVVGTIAERAFGGRVWLLLYFVSGLVGNIAGYVWQPTGAGASVAGAGLLGGCAVWMLLTLRRPQTAIGALLILVGAAGLTLFHDLHGPPILCGAILGSIILGVKRRSCSFPTSVH
jgi:membrane associated rhomboid family serine protease